MRKALLLVLLISSSTQAQDYVVPTPWPTTVYSSPAVQAYAARTYVSRSYVAAPVTRSVTVTAAASPTGAQRRHARKAARHALKAAYWASRS